jgi:hypothetical protein
MTTSLTKEALAYGQQKNREYCWEQAKLEFKEIFGLFDAENDNHDDWVSNRYLELCEKSNITPW